jgi:chorismate mutase/prephenate dehydratase
MDDLKDLRARLDGVDRRLVETLRERLETVAGIARVKAEGLSFLRDHERESELLERIEDWARELGLDPFRTQEIFREVIAMSLKSQEEALLKRERVERSARAANRVAFQGEEGSYSSMAARKYFATRSSEMEFLGRRSFAEALDAVERGDAGYAVLPIENTTAGSINQTYDLLRGTELGIVGEEILRIRHCLLGLEGAGVTGVRRILSHPQALLQCSRFLTEIPDVDQVAYNDTAAAARTVAAAGETAQAAIASAEAGERFGLRILAEDIADQDENWTRFVVISGFEIEVDPRIPAKTSMVFSTRHNEGALATCLNVLAEHGLNLSKLESRPVPRRPWEYMFYVDIEGSLGHEATSLALAELRRQCPYLRVLGSYPARTTTDGAVDRMSPTSD